MFSLGVIKVGTPAPGSILLTKKEEQEEETMSDDLFWREMKARLDQDMGDEAFHRALDDLEPPQRGGAAVDDEAGGAGPSRGRFDFRLDPFIDRRSQRLGVHERVSRARVHQRGTFDHHDQLAAALRGRVEDIPGPDVTRS